MAQINPSFTQLKFFFKKSKYAPKDLPPFLVLGAMLPIVKSFSWRGAGPSRSTPYGGSIKKGLVKNGRRFLM